MLSYKELKMFKQQVNYTFCIQVTELAMWAYFYLQLMTFVLGMFCKKTGSSPKVATVAGG